MDGSTDKEPVERSISPIEKISNIQNDDIDNQISRPELMNRNKKCQTSRNMFKTEFSLHLHETSNDLP